MSLNTNEPSKTRTVRIKEESDLVLEREADRAGTSVNALVSNLVDRYVDTLRFFQSGSMLSMSGNILETLLGHISDAEIADDAYALSKSLVREGLMQLGMKVNYDNVLWYIRQVLGKYYGWFRCDYNKGDASDMLHLSHNYGYKWSVFLSSYITSILKEVVNLQLNTVISDKSLNVQILKKS